MAQRLGNCGNPEIFVTPLFFYSRQLENDGLPHCDVTRMVIQDGERMHVGFFLE